MKRVLVALPFLFFTTLANAQSPFGGPHVDDERTAPPPARRAAPAPAAPVDAPPPADDADATASHSRMPVVRFDGGYAPRRLFALGVSGADLGFAIGAQPRQHLAWWVTERIEIGGTDNGLRVWSSRLGGEVEAVFRPVRFGIGASILVMGVGRAREQETLMSYGGEGRLFGRVDFVRTDDFALFLRVSLDGGMEVHGSAFWGPTLGVGFELGGTGEPAPTKTTAAR